MYFVQMIHTVTGKEILLPVGLMGAAPMRAASIYCRHGHNHFHGSCREAVTVYGPANQFDISEAVRPGVGDANRSGRFQTSFGDL